MQSLLRKFTAYIKSVLIKKMNTLINSLNFKLKNKALC